MTEENRPVDPAGAVAGEEPTQAPPSGEAPASGADDSAALQDAVEGASDETGGTGDPDVDTELEDLGAMKDSLAALTDDLQRLSAEYANYRKRVDRDRDLIRENAAYQALTPVIEVLDTIDRAREAGEVEGGFKSVADQLERAVATAGLVKFAEPGEPFDPTRHDALSHLGQDPEVEVTTIKVVAKSGYAIGERVVRAAQVLVVDPVEGE
ncbi:nucleotide exchange factor GrpE [Nocardioides seonyuensis]|uniref:Protein GrpE n=1 Tax=Nocardioides seonyuensis TaxID=2518371 RepID=A0A4P7IES7_9ACTN|nr:nucleotide exchange factor GrpE [Nocardioides seonyuensis]QBX55726.1 nucleotide exchange factor GrpE [Nocardioides seonyuensis]